MVMLVAGTAVTLMVLAVLVTAVVYMAVLLAMVAVPVALDCGGGVCWCCAWLRCAVDGVSVVGVWPLVHWTCMVEAINAAG